MNEETNSFSWTKLGNREVSGFFGHELLYDHVTNSLDEERRKAVEAYLSKNPDSQNEMVKMLNGLRYSERLSETQVSEEVLERINEPSTYLAVLLKKTNFQKWPSSVKWALEALVVFSLIITTTLFIPWDKLTKFNPFPESKETILAEINRDSQDHVQSLKELEAAEPAQFTDEVKPQPPEAVAKTETTVPPVDRLPEKPVPTLAKKDVDTAEAEAKESKKVAEGMLYRGEIAVTNMEMVGPKIKDKIIEMGGRKAGEVELGWKKTPKSSYFHFTVPEARYNELLEYFATYGKLKIVKEKHPRVMPDGIIRLIITVDEAGP